jgi:membrane-associated HD superfamily phosphohydrolase
MDKLTKFTAPYIVMDQAPCNKKKNKVSTVVKIIIASETISLLNFLYELSREEDVKKTKKIILSMMAVVEVLLLCLVLVNLSRYNCNYMYSILITIMTIIIMRLLRKEIAQYI